MVEPTGVPKTTAITMPNAAQLTERQAEQITTDLNFLKTRIAEIAGNILYGGLIAV